MADDIQYLESVIFIKFISIQRSFLEKNKLLWAKILIKTQKANNKYSKCLSAALENQTSRASWKASNLIRDTWLYLGIKNKK
jgi:hypothetical protein